MRVTRGAWIRQPDDDAGDTVTVAGQTIGLSEMGTAILERVEASEAPVDLDDILAYVIAEFGEPESALEARATLRHHVLELVAHGVLSDPDATREAFTPASLDALRGALRHVASDAGALWSLPPDVSGHQFVEAVRRHRVVASLASRLDRLDLPDDTAAYLRAMRMREAVTAEVQAKELAKIATSFADAGIRMLAIKGLALAVQAHGDVVARGTGDHDILVSPADAGRAHELLTSQGWVPGGGYPRPGPTWAWRRLVRDHHEIPLDSPISQVDLHWHASSVRHGAPTFVELWSRRQLVALGGVQVATLSPYDALTHSATHAAKDHWRWLRGILDVRLMIGQPAFWLDADRPLRRDQLLTVGLAARMLGTPPSAPPIVLEARRQAADAWETAVASQDGPAQADIATRVPGVGLFHASIATHRAGGGLGDHARALSLSLLPAMMTGSLDARTAFGAVPQVLRERTSEVTGLWSSAARRHLGSRS